MTIRSFRCADTESLYEGGSPRRFRNIENVAQRKLQMLDDAVELRDLRSPPGNRLEALSGVKRSLAVHIEVDCGYGRLGLTPS